MSNAATPCCVHSFRLPYFLLTACFAAAACCFFWFALAFLSCFCFDCF